MERNVPETLWLYPDRGMQKWLGWILSDHSSYMEDQSDSETPVKLETEQNLETVSELLRQFWEQSKVVSIQLKQVVNDPYLVAIEGAVLGVNNGQVFLQGNASKMQALNIEEIRHVNLIKAEKWWAV